MNDTIVTIAELKAAVEKFVTERDWQQFHDAKNLSIQLALEANELLEHFTWTPSAQIHERFLERKEEIGHEIADILFVLLAICNRYNLDLSTLSKQKMLLRAEKYPIEKAFATSKKYTEL